MESQEIKDFLNGFSSQKLYTVNAEPTMKNFGYRQKSGAETGRRLGECQDSSHSAVTDTR